MAKFASHRLLNAACDALGISPTARKVVIEMEVGKLTRVYVQQLVSGQQEAALLRVIEALGGPTVQADPSVQVIEVKEPAPDPA